VHPGEARVFAVVHLLHLAQHQTRIDGLSLGIDRATCQRVLPATLLWQYTLHQSPPFLQTSGRARFLIRAALAATLSGLWGMYSWFELHEAEALPGCEEYLNSEKYEIKHRNWNAP
jgi:hypothetical protein